MQVQGTCTCIIGMYRRDIILGSRHTTPRRVMWVMYNGMHNWVLYIHSVYWDSIQNPRRAARLQGEVEGQGSRGSCFPLALYLISSKET